MKGQRAVPLLAAVMAIAVSAPAAAAVSTPIGTGDEPVITVDGAGRAHIAWLTKGDAAVQYCRVPAGGSACELGAVLPKAVADQPNRELNIFAPTPDTLRIFSSTLCNGNTPSVARWESGNGGASWSGPVCKMTGTGRGTPTAQANVLDSQDRFHVGGGAESGKYYNALPPGTTPTTQAEITIFSTSNFYDVATAIIGSGADSRLVAASYSQTATAPGVRYSVFNGAPDTADLATLNNPANWETDIAQPGGEATIDSPQLISGPSGLFLVYHDRAQVLNDRVAVARFDPGARRFSASPLIVDGTGNDDFQSLPWAFQDAGGRLHLIWSGRPGTRYATSTDGGASFTVLGTLFDAKPTDRKFAAGADGRGWIVFQDENDRATVRLAPLEATPDGVAPPAPTPPVGGAGTPVPPSTTTTPPPTTTTTTTTTAARLPGSPGTPITRKTVSANGGRVTFGVPKDCVQPGQQFVVTMTWKKQKRKGNLFVKVFRADFFIGTRLVRTDRTVPFRQTLRVTATSRRGSTIRLRARAHIKVSKGKRIPKKSIFATIRVCSSP